MTSTDPILRRDDGGIDTDAYVHRARVLRLHEQRRVLAALRLLSPVRLSLPPTWIRRSDAEAEGPARMHLRV